MLPILFGTYSTVLIFSDEHRQENSDFLMVSQLLRSTVR